jgi:phage gpG-like protein
MPKITGAKAAKDRLARMGGKEKVAFVSRALFAAGEEIKAHAQKLITEGSVSGASHVPSRPGTAPHNDTGHLKNSIIVTQPDPLRVRISATAEYAAIHEFGGTINHPGGTPYFIDSATGLAVFVSKNSGSRLLGANLPVTKPHTITMPARPFMGPSARAKKKRVRELVGTAVTIATRKA